jgi:hypothetical protein
MFQNPKVNTSPQDNQHTLCERGAGKRRDSTGGEEEKEKEGMLIRETRMIKGQSCPPGCETNKKLSSSGG